MRVSAFFCVTLAGGAAVWAADSTPAVPAHDPLQQALYGAPRAATIEQVLASPAEFEGRAVSLRGRFARGRARGQYLLGAAPHVLRVEPLPAVAARVRARWGLWLEKDVELVGVFLRDRLVEEEAGRRYFLRFWKYEAPPPPTGPASDAPTLSLEDLVYSAGQADGKPVRIVGQFRGNNLRGDLPPVSRMGETDWVVKDDFYAVWVTGHGPDGDGFQLDPASLEDQENWVEIVGRPETRDGITYLKAQRVALAEPPARRGARNAPGRDALAAIPPAVVFTLPVNGEEGAPADVRLVVQFNKSMDQASFAGRVRLRPADASGEPEDVRLAYDEPKHALVVEPKRPLPAGRELVLELLHGIIDVHGLALTRPGAPADAALEAVRFRVVG